MGLSNFDSYRVTWEWEARVITPLKHPPAAALQGQKAPSQALPPSLEALGALALDPICLPSAKTPRSVPVTSVTPWPSGVDRLCPDPGSQAPTCPGRRFRLSLRKVRWDSSLEPCHPGCHLRAGITMVWGTGVTQFKTPFPGGHPCSRFLIYKTKSWTPYYRRPFAAPLSVMLS